MSTHHLGDLAYWFVFFLGECLWVLVCAAAAIRSKYNPIKSRREYVRQNWDIFLIRFAVEIIFYTAWRHLSLNELLTLTKISYQLPVQSGGPSGGGPVAAFFLGFGADALIGVASHWDKLPEKLRQWIQERIPEVPQSGPSPVSGPTLIKP